MLNLRLILCAVVVMGLVTQGAAQQPQSPQPQQDQQPQQDPQQPRPTFRTDINFVRVDVIVTEKGEPVTNLTQADFELREDNKPQAIEQFRMIKVDGNPKPDDPPLRPIRSRDDEIAEASRDDTRVIAIFLDDYHVRRLNGMSMRNQLVNFIQTQLRPTDMLAVMYPLSPVADLSFTRDHGSIIAAINNFEGRKFNYEARNQFEQRYERQPTEVVEEVRNQVVFGALDGLATRLGAIREGRKAVIYVSEGFTVLLPPQMRRPDASQPRVPVASAMAGENNTNEDRARTFASGDLYARMRDIYTTFNRNNASVYALDPRGLAVYEYGIEENVGPQQDAVNLQQTQDTLRVLSDETDGKAIVNRNDLVKGLQQIVRDTSYYYLIGYTSAAPSDGKFHEIKVNVRRRGLEVRGRRGFWAATAEDLARATRRAEAPGIPKAVETALATLSVPVQSSQAIRTWIGTQRGEAGKTRVTLVWEPIPGPPGARREPPGRVAVLAATDDGNVVYRGRTPEAPPAPGTAPGPQRVTFDAPPGSMELRLTVEAAAGGTLDNDTKRLTIPDLTAPQVAISTPRVFRGRTPREIQTIAADAAAMPATVREFSRTERVLIRFDTYVEGSETPTVTAQLLNRAGQKMADVPVAVATAGGTHQIDLGLNTIPPAEYLVEITAKTATGEVKELIALRVIS